MAAKTFKEDPAIIEQTANSMGLCADQIDKVFEGVDLAVAELSSWKSEAATIFQSNYESLKEDTTRVIGVAKEYSSDLVAISKTYANMQDAVNTAVGSLPTNI